MKKNLLSLTLALALALALPLGAAERAPQRPVNLNTATVTELMQLPRIGAKTAERIIAFVNSISKCESTVENANLQFSMRNYSQKCENVVIRLDSLSLDRCLRCPP